MVKPRKYSPQTSKLKTYYLVIDSSITPSKFLRLIRVLEEIKEPIEQVAIDLIITSPGGYGHSAFQMARMIREKCSHLKAVVPLYAKSAATLLVLASDVIIMGPQSELGPLDAQIEHPNEGKEISALDHVGSLEYLSGFAMELAFSIGIRARREIGLSRMNSIQLGLNFAEAYVKPLVSQLDPSLLNQSQRGLREAELYGAELMHDYMFKDDRNAKEKSQQIANHLVWEYDSHGYVIDCEEARDLGLKVQKLDEYAHKVSAWQVALNSLETDAEEIYLWTDDEFSRFEQVLKGSEDTNSPEERDQNPIESDPQEAI